MAPEHPPGESQLQEPGPQPDPVEQDPRDLTIDPEFHALIPPPTSDGLAGLEASIVAEGCRDKLLVWNGVLVDGHNRYEICHRHGIPFQVTNREFSDRAAAMDWMIANQLGRRNLTPDQFTILLGKRYNAQKETRGGNRRSKGQSDPLNTASTLARQHGVSAKTVKRAAGVVSSLPESKIVDVIQGKTTLRQAKRELRGQARDKQHAPNARLAKQTDNLVKSGVKYATIVIDPPWGGDGSGGAGQAMQPADVHGLPVADLAAADCHLYLWVPNESLPSGIALLKKWGFRYVTCLTWIMSSREACGLFCGFSEQVLFAIRDTQQFSRGDLGTVIYAPADPGGRGSRPGRFYDVVESCSPGPYLTMFDGRPRDRWTPWEPDGGGKERGVTVPVIPPCSPLPTAGAIVEKAVPANTPAPAAAKAKEIRPAARAVLEPERLARLLAGLIRKRDPEADVPTRRGPGKQSQLISWWRKVEDLNIKDGHDWPEIERIILWCQADAFWQAKILDPKKLRKHFAELVAAADQAGGGKPVTAPAPVSNADKPRPQEVDHV
jgi:N6-adenosine-specific RNA methylase IME4